MAPSAAWSAFHALSTRLKIAIDVLIQISENYYEISETLPKYVDQEGGNALRVIRSAMGLETIGRIYRLMDSQVDAESFPKLADVHLTDQQLLDELFAAFNYDGRKTRDEFDDRVRNLRQFVRDIADSDEMKRVRVFRQRYVGHLVPNPRDLKKFGAIADVHQFSSAEIRKITDGLSHVVDQLFYLIERGEFPFDQIAKLSRDDARALWKDRD